MSSTSTSIELVDMHCHVDLYPNVDEVVKSIERRRVHTIAVTNAPSVFWYTEKLAKDSQYIEPAVGLHPELVATRRNETAQLWEILERTQVIGEVGLDYSAGGDAVYSQQREVFSEVLTRCAALKNKVISVHSRQATADTISIVGRNYPGRVILHWFSGTMRDLERAIEYGFYFSVNPSMAKSQKGVLLISKMPRERVLTETDGPFVKIGRVPASPPQVEVVVDALARVWGTAGDEAARIVLRNYKNVMSEI